MDAIIQNSLKQTVALCRAKTAKKRKRKKAGSFSTGKRHASTVTAFPTVETTIRSAPTALAAAVDSALKVSRKQPYRYLLATTLMGTCAMAQAQGISASINLQDLDGNSGFVINGVGSIYAYGSSVSSAGDINGDGLGDVIIGATDASPAGESYVLFGGGDVGNSGSLNLSDLDGVSGFVINGIDNFDASGGSVNSAGDVNGDGVDDVIIGARNADPNGVGEAGESYVVFGGDDVGSSGSLNLADLDGVNGFVINGIETGNNSGSTVRGAGDINGDGVDDMIIGAPSADRNGINNAGESYVVFGGRDVGNLGSLNLSDLNGMNGFVINGISANDFTGESINSAGDINGDGLDDVIIGAPNANPNGLSGAGESYVVFGGTEVGNSGSLNLSDLDGVNGFVIAGSNVGDSSGGSVDGAGDINGDGLDDVIISARLADPNGVDEAGEIYVVFGGGGIGSSGLLNLSDLDGIEGFVINGIGEFSRSGTSGRGAGDINGDGVDDVIFGASYASPNGVFYAGESYVVFGGNNVGSGGSLNLSDLNGANGFVINGINDIDLTGESVSGAGDMNGDGVDDVIIGTRNADAKGYVVFGVLDTPVTPPPDAPDNDQFENARFLDSANKALVSELTLTVKGTMVNATAQSGEPAHFQGGFGLPPGPENSIWYQWTPEADQVVEVDTAGSAVSTVLVAYTGDTLSGLQEIATGIDNVREVSRIRFAVHAGETYHFAIDGYEEIREGTIQLNLRQPRLDPSECTIKGTNGSDSLVGTPGPDVICALGGDDFIKTLGGDDIIFAGEGADFVSADGDNDIVFGEEGNDVMTGASGDDVLIGGRATINWQGPKATIPCLVAKGLIDSPVQVAMMSYSERATKTGCPEGAVTIILMADLPKISVWTARARTRW